MNFQKELQTLIIPIIKGLPIIVALVMLSILFTRRVIKYTTPEYQSSAALKLDNRDFSTSTINIFDSQGFSNIANDVMTEIEVFKSKNLIQKAFEKLDFDVSYYRIGDIRTTEMYKESPFTISYKLLSPQAQDKLFYLRYQGNNIFELLPNKEAASGSRITVDSLWKDEHISFTIKKNEALLTKKMQALQIDDLFGIQFNSFEKLAKNVNADNFYVRPVDKDVSIVKLYYQHEVPAKAALFLNALMQTYVEDYQSNKENNMDGILQFVNQQLASVEVKLKESEANLANYKAQNGIVNAIQETDATIKQLSEFNTRIVNYDIQEAELNRLFEYLATGNSLQGFSPNFESLLEPVFKDSYLKAQNLELEKQDLLLKYQPESDIIVNIENKISSLRVFINESVKNTLENIGTKRTELEQAIAKIDEKIKKYPNKERETAFLQREVMLNEQMYNLLAEKRTELAIARRSNHTFHKVLDPATIASTPISPNKPLYYGVAVFFALLGGIGFSFLKHFMTAKIKNKKDLTEMSNYPIIGFVNRVRDKRLEVDALTNLYTNIEILQRNQLKGETPIITITSMLPNEGKTFTATNLAKLMSMTGKKVLLIDMDLRKPSVHNAFDINNNRGMAAIIEKKLKPKRAIVRTKMKNLQVIPGGKFDTATSPIIFSLQNIAFIHSLKESYDLIIIDTPPLGMVVDAVPLMHQADLNLLVVRSEQSKIRNFRSTSDLIEEFAIPNLYLVLNDVKRRSERYYGYDDAYYNPELRLRALESA